MCLYRRCSFPGNQIQSTPGIYIRRGRRAKRESMATRPWAAPGAVSNHARADSGMAPAEEIRFKACVPSYCSSEDHRPGPYIVQHREKKGKKTIQRPDTMVEKEKEGKRRQRFRDHRLGSSSKLLTTNQNSTPTDLSIRVCLNINSWRSPGVSWLLCALAGTLCFALVNRPDLAFCAFVAIPAGGSIYPITAACGAPSVEDCCTAPLNPVRP